MPANEILQLIGSTLALIASAGIVVIWFAYGFLFRWTKTRPGRALFYLLTALVLMMVYSSVTAFVGPVWGSEDWNWRLVFRIFIMSVAVFAVIKFGVSLVSNWRRTGRVLDLEARARRAEATLDGKPITKETPVP